jgi:hypothetical protein
MPCTTRPSLLRGEGKSLWPNSVWIAIEVTGHRRFSDRSQAAMVSRRDALLGSTMEIKVVALAAAIASDHEFGIAKHFSVSM